LGRPKERKDEDEYGECIFYPHMKIEEWNLLKLLCGVEGKRENDRRDKSN
jgi:hypothetical protein